MDESEGVWCLLLVCCGRHDGYQVSATWEEADGFRKTYIDAEGHEREAILTELSSPVACGYHHEVDSAIAGAAAGASTPVCPHIETSDEGTSHCTLAVAGATSVAPPAPTAGAELIAAERRRQVEAEGWTPEHDAEHTEGDLIEAAIAYAVEAAPTPLAPEGWPWPWHADYWKPTADPARNLIKAGALIAAELDRLLAAGSSPAGVPQKDDR